MFRRSSLFLFSATSTRQQRQSDEGNNKNLNNSSTSLLFPLRAAQKAGLPITREIIEPVIDQIIQNKKWMDALDLFSAQNNEIIITAFDVSKNHPSNNQNLAIIQKLTSESPLLFPNSTSNEAGMWQTTLEFMKLASSINNKSNNNNNNSKANSSASFSHCGKFEEMIRKIHSNELMTRTSNNNNNNKPNENKGDNFFVVNLAEKHLAPNGKYNEIHNLRQIISQLKYSKINNNNSSSGRMFSVGQSVENSLTRFEMSSQLQFGRWIGATKCLKELIDQNNNNNSKFPHQKRHIILEPILPYPETLNLLKKMKRYNRWMEGANIFNVAFNDAVNNSKYDSNNAKSNESSKLTRMSDILGASVSLIASSMPRENENGNFKSNSNNHNHESCWWLSLRALSLLQRDLHHLPVTLEIIEAKSEVMAFSSSSSSSSSAVMMNHHKNNFPIHQNSKIIYTKENYPSTSTSPSFTYQADVSKTGTMIIDLAKSNRWQLALEMLPQLPPGSTSLYEAGRCAGAIMVQMSKIQNWVVAFQVYSSVVKARARITKCTRVQESDQRALLFVCAEQRRWFEAFRLLQAGQKQISSQHGVATSEANFFAFETKPDRYGIAFNSRPPWDVALKYARAAWPKISGSDPTKITVLSGVAASALEHARIEEEGQQYQKKTLSSGSSSSALEIGVKLVERMFAQNLFPKGEVIALLPEKQAIEATKNPLVPLVEILQAIRICGHGLQQNQEQKNLISETVTDTLIFGNLGAINWRKSLIIAGAAIESVRWRSNKDNLDRNSDFGDDSLFKILKYCKAGAETLLLASATLNHQQQQQQWASSSGQRNQRGNEGGVNHYQHSLNFLSTTFSRQNNIETSRHPYYYWEAALQISSVVFESLLQAQHQCEKDNKDNDNSIFLPYSRLSDNSRNNNDDSDNHNNKFRSVLQTDIRATCAMLLHVLSHSNVSAFSKMLNKMENFGDFDDKDEEIRKTEKTDHIPYRWYRVEHGPFGIDSHLRLAANWNITAQLLDHLLRAEETSSSSSSSSIREPLWTVTIRNCFFHCALNHHENKEIAERGLKFYELMCNEDDGLRESDGRRVVELCAVLSTTNMTLSERNRQIECSWIRALRYLQPLQERSSLNSEAVSTFMYRFDSQWLRATEIFMTRYRDTVFRTLLSRGKITLS